MTHYDTRILTRRRDPKDLLPREEYDSDDDEGFDRDQMMNWIDRGEVKFQIDLSKGIYSTFADGEALFIGKFSKQEGNTLHYVCDDPYVEAELDHGCCTARAVVKLVTGSSFKGGFK